MKHYFLLLLAPLALFGCATLMPLDDGLTPFKGKPVNRLFNVIGFPNNIELVNNKIVHTYLIERNHVGLVTETEYTTGLEGQDPLIAKTMMQPTQVNVECALTVITNKQKIIEQWKYEETYEGCTPYRVKLADFVR
ncbi:hypothetical protein [Paraglaciecola sp. 20A4]|uniref:hypothetical protein n=1 Tax=Paraglaciecola sp. 20A4 TaxID=2687288 RepID=UPI001409FEC1|nr:hypothetical protein [Paraglaciecola sp. 20A4]